MHSEDSSAAARLARLVKARREELELTQREAADLAGLGLSTWQGVEYGKRNGVGRETRHGVEDALGWTRGSVKAVIDGHDPEVRNDDDAAKPTIEKPSDVRTMVGDVVEVEDLAVGALTGKGVVSVKIKALGVDVSSTFDDAEDRATVIAQMLAGLGLEGADSAAGGIHLPVPSEWAGQGSGVADAEDDLGVDSANGS